MSVVDRFICRREGHIPSVRVTSAQPPLTQPYLTTCQRCGKWFEVPPVTAEETGE